MKNLIVLITAILSTSIFLSHPAMAVVEGTGFKKINSYNVATTTGGFALTHTGGWGLAGCPSASQISVGPALLGFDLLFTTAVLAYTQDLKVFIYAECSGGNWAALKSLVIETKP